MKNKFFILFFAIIFMFAGCTLKSNQINDNKNLFTGEQLNGENTTINKECTCYLHANVMNFPKEPLSFSYNNESISINVEDFSNMLHLSGMIYKHISNFMPQQPFIADDTVGNIYAYIPFEIGGGNNSGSYLLLKFNLTNRKTEGVLKLPRQNIYINQISASPSSENLAIVTAYTDIPMHFNTSSKLNLFLSIVNLNSMSVDYTFKFETHSDNDVFSYNFAKWVDDNNLVINLFDANGVLQTELLNLEYIFH